MNVNKCIYEMHLMMQYVKIIYMKHISHDFKNTKRILLIYESLMI